MHHLTLPHSSRVFCLSWLARQEGTKASDPMNTWVAEPRLRGWDDCIKKSLRGAKREDGERKLVEFQAMDFDT